MKNIFDIIDFEKETTFDQIDIYWQKAKASEYYIQKFMFKQNKSTYIIALF